MDSRRFEESLETVIHAPTPRSRLNPCLTVGYSLYSARTGDDGVLRALGA